LKHDILHAVLVSKHVPYITVCECTMGSTSQQAFTIFLCMLSHCLFSNRETQLGKCWEMEKVVIFCFCGARSFIHRKYEQIFRKIVVQCIYNV